MVLSYALPLMIGLGVTSVIKDWKLGYFAYIAKEVSIRFPRALIPMKINFTNLSLAFHISQSKTQGVVTMILSFLKLSVLYGMESRALSCYSLIDLSYVS